MKKYLFILLSITSSLSTLLAQNTCTDQGTTTNPDNPFEPRTTPTDPNGTVVFLNNKFDWRTNYYNWWEQINGNWLSSQILSPYTSINNPNLVGYIDKIPADNRPEDGWELITYGFGKFYNGNFNQEDHPRFILYNRYTGVLRIFLYYNMPISHSNYQTGRIRLSFSSNTTNTYQSAILTYTESIPVPLDEFTKRHAFNNINEINVTTGEWLVADFPMAYDPCTCLNTYDLLEVKLDLIENSSVTIEGRISTLDNLIVVNKAKSNNFPADYKGTLGSRIVAGSLDMINQGQKTFNSFSEFYADLNTILLHEKTSRSKDAKVDEVVNKIPLLIDAIPYLESAKGLIEFFTGGGMESNGNAISPISFEADVNLSGTIETTQPGTYQYLVVPGSIPQSSAQLNYIPMYNEILGVFNLVETPELEFTDYLLTPTPQCSPAFTSPPAVRQFKVTKPIAYAVNPAAHLEIEKFDATFTITYDKDEIFGPNQPIGDFFDDPIYNPVISMSGSVNGPIFTNRYFPRPFEEFVPGYPFNTLPYEERINRIGMGIETWNDDFPNSGQVVLNTSWVPVGAIQDQSFMLYRDAYWDNNPYGLCYDGFGRFADPIIRLKVHITFRRTDNPNAQKVTFIASYKVKFTPHPFLLSNPGAFTFTPLLQTEEGTVLNPGPVFTSINNLVPMGTEYLNLYRLPIDLDVSNTTLGPGTVSAIRSIHIGDNVTIASGTTLKASKEITIDPTNVIDPTVSTQLEYPTSNANLNPEQMKTTDFSSICNNLNKYNPIVPEAETAPPMPQEKANATTQPNDFAIYPNPASHQAKIVYSIAKDAHAKITVTDAMGKEVFILVNGFHTQGQYIQSIDASLLPPGIYFCRLERNGEVAIKKFTIIK